jgi:hypothetical protein
MEPAAWETPFRLMISASWVVSIACQIAIVVAIATLVRRQRPDAWKPILAWAIAVGAMWLWPPLAAVLFRDEAEGGVSGIYRMQVLQSLVSIPLHVATVALLIHGLVTLARPPRPAALPSEPPYR